jgi:hypothetical protein
VAAAAHDVLVVVCPAAVATLDAAFKPYKDGHGPGAGRRVAAAAALLPHRRPTPVVPDFTGGTGIGEWRPTPPAELPMAFLFMATTEPFTLTSPDQFRPDDPPAVNSHQYTREYYEVKRLGSVQSHPATGTCPSPGPTDMARFWSGNFGAQWNEAARNIAIDQQLSIGDSARLMALVNLAAADAAIAVWDSKRFFNFWRPITAIREGNNDGKPVHDRRSQLDAVHPGSAVPRRIADSALSRLRLRPPTGSPGRSRGSSSFIFTPTTCASRSTRGRRRRW